MTPSAGSGWLSSAGCVMIRPGLAVLKARSSFSDCSLSSTDVILQPCMQDRVGGWWGWESRAGGGSDGAAGLHCA